MTTPAPARTGEATLTVRVRYFAAAAEAAGTAGEDVTLGAGATAADLVAALSARGPALARVLAISSLLVDGVVREDLDRPLADTGAGTATLGIDVLPPFAGG